jgi:hypothetical protein
MLTSYDGQMSARPRYKFTEFAQRIHRLNGNESTEDPPNHGKYSSYLIDNPYSN